LPTPIGPLTLGVHRAVASSSPSSSSATDATKAKIIELIAPSSHALQAAGAFLHGAEFLEELTPADNAFFSAF
jgi:hypothetical protein